MDQVRPDHRRRLHRRHGERERDDAGGLAARRARLPRPALVPARAHPARAGAPVVRRPGHRGELGQLLAQRGLRRVHAGPVLGREARRGARRTTTTSPSTSSSSRTTRAGACRSRRTTPTTSTPRARWCCGCSRSSSGPSRSGRRSTAISPATPYGNADERRPPRRPCSTPPGRISAGSGPSGSTRPATRSSPSSAAYDSAAGAVTLDRAADAAGHGHADSTGLRFVVPLVVPRAVAIRVGTAAGDVVRRVMIDRREQTVRIDGVRSRADDGRLRRRQRRGEALAFEQPTPWLARSSWPGTPISGTARWAIEQLAARTERFAGGAALAAAARGADYPLTRAQAAAALAGFPAAVAAPRARGRAARHLGAGARGARSTVADAGPTSRRGPGSADSSYEVRAAALTALARLDPERARPADRRRARARRPIGTRSRTRRSSPPCSRPDSGLVAGLERIAGAQELPTAALGVIAARGNPQAKAALARSSTTGGRGYGNGRGRPSPGRAPDPTSRYGEESGSTGW